MSKLATKFREMADKLGPTIAGKRQARDENTPRKSFHAKIQRCEADEMERVQKALVRLADAHAAGTVPETLAGIKSKTELTKMLHTRLDHSRGYYDIYDTGEYPDQSPTAVALRAFLAADVDPAEEAGRARLKAIQAAEDKVRFAPIPGFFPTPPEVIEQMMDRADVRPGHKVLEPSAGKGDIAEAVRAAGATVVACELVVDLQRLLTAKGFDVVAGDFLERFSVLDPQDGVGTVTGGMRQFDRVVMNPPFEKGQDIDHVRHAFKLLKDGGRLVSVMSTGPFFRSDKKATEFREWLESVGGEKIDLPDDAFAKAFRATGTKTVLVLIDR